MTNDERFLNNKKYGHDDMAPIGCDDCRDCDSCCHGMGDTIVQDPYDMWLFCKNMRVAGGAQITFELLISEDGPWELSYQDGVVLPNIKMVEDGRCPFLNDKRCTIHPVRSGLCRLFPLGRSFDDDKIDYYVMGGRYGCEMHSDEMSMVRIKDWLGYPDIDRYEMFQVSWHEIKANIRDAASELSYEEYRHLQERLLDVFYSKPYQDDFFEDYERRVSLWKM